MNTAPTGMQGQASQMKEFTPDDVRTFLLTRYSEPMRAMRVDIEEVPDDFDFLLAGVIDSFGILEMVSAIEKEFEIQLDLELLDAEDITKIGPLARYTAASATTVAHARRWSTGAKPDMP